MTAPRPIEPAPLALSEEQAARHVGIGKTLFRELVQEGVYPAPRRVRSRVLWSRVELEAAFHALSTEESETVNEWDEVFR